MTSSKVQRAHQQQARKLVDEHGGKMPYTVGLRKTAQPEPPAADPAPARRHVNADDLDWSRTWGHRLVFSHPRRKSFTALVLPPEPGSRRRPWRLRVLAETETAPRTVDGRTWTITPDPAGLSVAGFGRGQRKRDPYTPLPDGFATESMLREQHRKRPAKGQHPAGIWHGKWHDSPVYWIDDADDLPPLTGKAAERWSANRTCAECGQTSGQPWTVDPRTGQRACERCKQMRSSRLWRQRRETETAAATAWAADLVADPATVIVTVERRQPDWDRFTRFHHTVQTLDGTVLFADFVEDLYRDSDEVRQRYNAVLDQAATLSGRRMVFGDTHACQRFRTYLAQMASQCGRDCPAYTAKASDAIEPRYWWWWDRADEAGWTDSADRARPVMDNPPWGFAAQLGFTQIQTLLGDMAAGRIPGQPQ